MFTGQKSPVIFMILYSIIAGIICSIGGYYLAVVLDSSIAGAITTVLGAGLVLAFLFSPEKGYISMLKLRRSQKYEFAELALLIHLDNHKDTEKEHTESSREHLQDHFSWEKSFSDRVLLNLEKKKLLLDESGYLKLSKVGEEFVETKKQDFFSIT
jgi:manganese/zinc/iron transport system permease protein